MDMNEIKEIFFQECEEQLAELESGLLKLNDGDRDPETVNAVFRAVHSIKGGAGAFGLDDLVAFAHVFETTLDCVRSNKLEPTQDVLKVMLRSADVLADLTNAARDGGSVDESRTRGLVKELEALANGEAVPASAPAPVAVKAPEPVKAPAAPKPTDESGFEPIPFSFSDFADETTPLMEVPTFQITFKPHASLYSKGNEAALLLRDLSRIGDMSVNCDMHVETALLGLNSLDDAIKLYRRARRECCDLMSAFEFMPPVAFTLAIEAIPDLKMPIAGDYPAYVLMEISGSGLVDTADLMGRFLEGVMEDGLVLDGVIASSRAQAQSLWLFREGMNEGQALRGSHMRTDISVPLSKLAAFVAEAEAELAEKLPECLAVSYGHVGDGNVHLNVLPPNGATLEEREAFIYKSKTLVNEVLDRYVGSISAEHGIGRLKRSDFESRLSDVQRRMITGLKNAFDPDLRMNPGCQITLQPDS